MRRQTVQVGLISDTHMPQRWKSLPDSLPVIFAEVDLILHAGDVGELWVLDELSRIAPVVAVHGNDETAQAREALPFHQTMSVAGHRIVLTHSHHPASEREAQARRLDGWESKLEDRAAAGKRHDADIAVSGHTHVPMVTQHDGIWLINPGAIASGSLYTRQTIQTVAIMTLQPSRSPRVTHIDVNQPDEPHLPLVDWQAGFAAAQQRYSVPIFEPELLATVGWFRERILPIAPQHAISTLSPLAHECWSGDRTCLTAADIVRAFAAHPDTPKAIIEGLKESPVFARYL